MAEVTEIIYTFNSEDYKELLYTTKGSRLTPTRIKRASILLIASITTLVIVSFFSMRFPSFSFVIVFAALAIIGCTINFFTELYQRNKLIKQIDNYLTYMEGRKLNIKVNKDFFKLETDEETVIESFKEVKSVIIRDEVITLKGESGASYYFIAKSMGEENFKRLKAMIESKLI